MSGAAVVVHAAAPTTLDWGADAIYDIVDSKLEFMLLPRFAPQLEQENCVARQRLHRAGAGRDPA